MMGTAGQNELFSEPKGAANSVAVIIPTFNHAQFLPEAILSVRAQTRPADEVIVVDDGSTDNTASVLAEFPEVRVIRQENRGVSCARNLGIRNAQASHIIFLDADDRLLPTALQTGLNCISGHPDAVFAYGGCSYVSGDGRHLGSYVPSPIDDCAFLTFLARNQIGGIMTVVFRRDCLLEMNGFDETLQHGEDYDLYLRTTRKYRVASHAEIVGEYRRHGANASNDSVAQLKASLLILDRHEKIVSPDAPTRVIFRNARAMRRSFYVERMLREGSVRWRAHHDMRRLAGDLMEAMRWSPLVVVRLVSRYFVRRLRAMLST